MAIELELTSAAGPVEASAAREFFHRGAKGVWGTMGSRWKHSDKMPLYYNITYVSDGKRHCCVIDDERADDLVEQLKLRGFEDVQKHVALPCFSTPTDSNSCMIL